MANEKLAADYALSAGFLARLAAVTLLGGFGASCFAVVDLDHRGTTSTGADGGSTSSSTGTSANGGGGSGAGDLGGAGGEACGGVDLATDEDNCGECGFDCGAAECVAGTCGASFDFAGTGDRLTSVRVVGDVVYIVQKATADFTGAIRTLPVDFDANSTPGLNHAVQNSIGSLVLGTVGSHYVYFAGQVSKLIYACNPDECLPPADLLNGIATQVNGMTAVDETLYIIAAGNDNRLLSLPIDSTTGAPDASGLTELVNAYTPPITNAGVIELFYRPSPPRLFWSSYDFEQLTDGCIYRATISELSSPPISKSCFSPVFITQGFTVTNDGATIFAQDGPTTVQRISGDPPTMEVFATNAKPPRTVDEDNLYVGDATTGAIRALPLDGGAELPGSEPPPVAPYSIDASHPEYVFYTAGSVLYRWAKP